VSDRPIALEILERYLDIVPDREAFLASNLSPEPQNLRIRGGRVSPEAIDASLAAQGFELAPVPGLPSLRKVVSAPHSPAQTLEHWLGHIHVQQAVMALPSLALDPRPGERVLDLCAAPGGKTSHLADLMEDRGCLVAVDPKEKRLRGLMANLFRLGHTNTLVVASDGRELPSGALFDRVLVDAPCSAEGNFRRQKGRLPRHRPTFSAYVTHLQESLLRSAIRLTRPGGTLVYSTCTWAPEENERVLARVLADCPVELEPIPLTLPHAPGLTEWNGERFPDAMVHSWRLYPEHLDSGGAFVARLRRLDDGTSTSSADRSTGWSAVPPVFPGEPLDDARARIAEAEAVLATRFDFDGDHHGHQVGWMVRNENIWAETAGEWPVEGWKQHGGWRVVSMGLRAFRQGSDGRETPSNGFLSRFASSLRRGVVEVSDAELAAILSGVRAGAGATEANPPGPVAVRWRGNVLGRAMLGQAGLDLQIPRSQALRLEALLGLQRTETPGTQ
jgi:NOL1/NOP2/sun family putative RNA methylase